MPTLGLRILGLVVSLLLVLPLCGPLVAEERSESPARVISEDFVCEIPGRAEGLRDFRANATGSRVAWVIDVGDRKCVGVNGKREKPYDAIADGSLVLSPNGRRYAYVARRGIDWFAVIDGVEGRPYTVVTGGPQFSPNSRRVAYTAQGKDVTEGKALAQGCDKCVFVLDGQEKLKYAGSISGTSFFSPDSQRFAYWISLALELADQHQPVVDGAPKNPLYSGIAVSDVVFSPDSTQVAYAPIVQEKARMVVDGALGKEMGKPYDSVSRPVFSADSRRCAYVAYVGNVSLVVADGTEGKIHDVIAANMPIFSPDGKRLAYVAQSRTKWVAVIDQKEGKQYDYIAADSMRFSPDGAQLAYVARAGQSWFVVVNDCESRAFPAVDETGPVFSPDSKRLAYAANAGGRWFLFVNHKEAGIYHDIARGSVAFSPDSRYVACAGRFETEWGLFVNGACVNWYDEIIMHGGPEVVFLSNDSIRYLVRKGGNICFVEEKFR